MKKIESARIIVKQGGDCKGISCVSCFCGIRCATEEWWHKDEKEVKKIALALAEAYIKRHEGKSKKKHVEETSYIKKLKKDYVQNLEQIKDPAKHEPQPLRVVCVDNSYNSEYPQPIRFDDPVPEYAYLVEGTSITVMKVLEMKLKKTKTKNDTFSEFCLYVDINGTFLYRAVDNNIYRTPEEALIVAKKLWSVK